MIWVCDHILSIKKVSELLQKSDSHNKDNFQRWCYKNALSLVCFVAIVKDTKNDKDDYIGNCHSFDLQYHRWVHTQFCCVQKKGNNGIRDIRIQIYTWNFIVEFVCVTNGTLWIEIFSEGTCFFFQKFHSQYQFKIFSGC